MQANTHTQALEKTCDPGLELGKLRGLEGIKSYTLSLSLSLTHARTHTCTVSSSKHEPMDRCIHTHTRAQEVCVTQFIIRGC